MPMQREILEAQLAPEIDQKATLDANCPMEYAGDPTGNIAPRHLYDFCVDTSGGHLYWASSLVAAGWKKLNN